MGFLFVEVALVRRKNVSSTLFKATLDSCNEITIYYYSWLCGKWVDDLLICIVYPCHLRYRLHGVLAGRLRLCLVRHQSISLSIETDSIYNFNIIILSHFNELNSYVWNFSFEGATVILSSDGTTLPLSTYRKTSTYKVASPKQNYSRVIRLTKRRVCNTSFLVAVLFVVRIDRVQVRLCSIPNDFRKHGQHYNQRSAFREDAFTLLLHLWHSANR